MHSKQPLKRKLLAAGLGALLCFAVSLSAHNTLAFSVIAGLSGAALGFAAVPLLEKRRRKKELRMYEIDMADYLINVSLLLSSGLTLWDSLRRANNGTDSSRPLYRELTLLFDGIDSGKYLNPVAAFEAFASTHESPAISTLTGVIVQNYRKGSGEVASIFRELSVSARNNRKYLCIKLADEATTLLLIPSTLVLIAIMALLITPAVLTLLNI